MYLYNIGYGTYEESEHVQLMHSERFSEQELHLKVVAAIIRVLQKIVDGHKFKRTINGKEYDSNPLVTERGVSFQEIFEPVIDELKLDGFVKVTFETQWSTFGWPSLTDPSDWRTQRDEVNEVADLIPAELKDKINELGKKQEAALETLLRQRAEQRAKDSKP